MGRVAAPMWGVEAIIGNGSHVEVVVLRDGKRESGERGDELRAGGRLTAADGVIFNEFFAIDPDGAVANVDGFTGKADDALDVIGLRGIERRLEDDDLLALGFAPQGNMNVGERNPGVVADAAHDEGIADQQRGFHSSVRNY